MKQKPSLPDSFSYCLVIMAVVIALLGIVAVFNALVDPFGMYRKLEIVGFNNYKPAIYNRMRLYKAFEVKRVAPQTLILGSSRSHIGLRCSHPALKKLEGPCYNLAFDGATAKEMYYYLLHANAIRHLKHVILGLDSYHASPAPAFTRPDFDPLLLESSEMPYLARFITADIRLLTSLDTLSASFQTIMSQNTTEPNWFAPDGQRLGEVFFHEKEPTFMQSGPLAYFDSIDRQEVQDQTGSAPKIKISSQQSSPNESSRSYIKRIIAFCREQNIDLGIFITPSHMHQSEIAASIWGEQIFDTSKRALVQLLVEDAALSNGKQPVTLIDFSGYSSVTTDPLPAIGSRDEMRFYWDSSHFKEIVGDYVLNKLFDFNNQDEPTPDDFGVVLNAQTLDAVLNKQHEARSFFRKKFLQDVAAIHSLLPGLPILVYHQIRTSSDSKKEPWDESTTISLDAFKAQMQYLADQGFTTLSMNDVMRYLKGETFPSKVVAIHFDDGWQSAQEAIPILNQFGFKATFLIIAKSPGNGWPNMDWEMIKELAKNPNFDIYSHTMTHPWKSGDMLVDWVEGRTKGKGVEQAIWELTESRRVIEEQLGKPVPYLAWPRGIYNDKLIDLAKQAGYYATLTIDDGVNHPGDNPFFIRRTMVRGCNISSFQKILLYGKYQDCQDR